MKGLIYKYTFPDGKVYIGQTRRNPEVRQSEHVNNMVGPKNSGFWEAYQKYGTYKYEEIWEVESDDEDALVHALNILETSFILNYKAYDPQYGYNRSIMGTVGTKTKAILRRKRAELRKTMLDIRMKDYKSAYEKIFETKKPLTQEEKYLVVEKYREENVMRIHNFDFDHLKENDYDERTMFELEEHLSFIHCIIESDVDDELDKYMNENGVNMVNEEKKGKVIVQMDKEGEVLKEFSSLNEICQHLHIPSAENVRNVLKGKQKSAYGFLWKYKKDVS